MAADIQFNVDQALAKLGELVAKHGPQAVDLAASVAQVEAAGQLAQGGVAALIVAALGIGSARFWKTYRQNAPIWRAYREDERKHGYPYLYNDGKAIPRPIRPDAFPEEVSIAGCGAMAVFAFLGAVFAALPPLTYAWNWVALFNPKLALAHQVLAKFAGL